MKLIKEIGSKSWINSSGKKDTKKFGIFLCPSCNKEVEKPILKGIAANSCGDKNCRKITFRANKKNIGNKKLNKITDQKYYSTIKERFRLIKNKYKLCEKWKTANDFYKDMIDSYIEARKYSHKILFTVENENEEINSTNCKWTPMLNYRDYPYDTNKRYIYIVVCGNYTKIGISKNISERMTALQTGNPFPINLVFAKVVEDAENIEKIIHTEYNEFNISGEWFDIEKKQINDIIYYINNI